MIEWYIYGIMDLLNDRLMEWRKDGLCNYGIMAWWNGGMDKWLNNGTEGWKNDGMT